MIKRYFGKYGRGYFLERHNVGNKLGKCLYVIKQDGEIKGYEVHKLRLRKNFHGEMSWLLASENDFGHYGWYYMASEKEAALNRYESIVFQPELVADAA